MKTRNFFLIFAVAAIAFILSILFFLLLNKEKTYQIKVVQNIKIENKRIENVNGLVCFINLDTKAYSIRSCTDSAIYTNVKLNERYLIITKSSELNEDIYNRLYTIHKFAAYLQTAFDNNINANFYELNDFVSNFILLENINARKALTIYLKLFIENDIYTKFFKDSGIVMIEYVKIDSNIRREFRVKSYFSNDYFIFE